MYNLSKLRVLSNDFMIESGFGIKRLKQKKLHETQVLSLL